MMSQYSTVELQASYGIGRQIGDQVASNPFEGLDANAVAQGVMDALNGAEFAVEVEDLREAFGVINERMQAAQAEQAKEASAEGQTFLDENAKRDEVTVTESGLQYEVLVAGEGEKPTAASTVKTHYHGTLVNGTVFDSSYDRGQPAEFPVGGVIKGWTEALQLMSVGSKWRLAVPYELAYGEQGAGGAIGPFQTLIFDVELLEIIA
ncbi:FKBP-type peptidyl-prolyl cis-trans isomerase [Psychrosphaera sp. 1_MG-2023]|uniref:Peptidyl-prolyl cis-trans isomerase n=1 Tax=Psychrosphaera algicola TaxID=3023714 RepID=A0ABT5FI26_9GAMM|nr:MULTISPECIES: FKBP-type peptidyl-prolyl cis-trans isomerase [unclassified Psychrosphaera]MDC2890848.1 FKBP-type peptidyl-prolyl cis-trans isomerase [Psychrosphaera sp. G1-22]MDO6719481.1 FKBP-type peptidyl-prolyl cis-trans isomerase [Psychrosphaera sp. 1_MG-2023]